MKRVRFFWKIVGEPKIHQKTFWVHKCPDRDCIKAMKLFLKDVHEPMILGSKCF